MRKCGEKENFNPQPPPIIITLFLMVGIWGVIQRCVSAELGERQGHQLRAELARILVSEQTERPMGDFLKYIDQWETSENVDSKLAP